MHTFRISERTSAQSAAFSLRDSQGAPTATATSTATPTPSSTPTPSGPILLLRRLEHSLEGLVEKLTCAVRSALEFVVELNPGQVGPIGVAVQDIVRPGIA
jgi:hypothetical protein